LAAAGCAQSAGKSTSPTSTLSPLRTIDITPPTTIPVPPTTTSRVGYVAVVVDGATFDFQDQSSAKRYVMAHIQVPPIGSCEGDLARALLASMIAGKPVRIDGDGVVWRDDTDVGLTMVSYGYATHVDEWYQAADTESPDLNCALTVPPTTVGPTIVVVQAPRNTPRPRPKVVTTPEPVVETEPPPEETEPPVVQTEPEPPPETPAATEFKHRKKPKP